MADRTSMNHFRKTKIKINDDNKDVDLEPDTCLVGEEENQQKVNDIAVDLVLQEVSDNNGNAELQIEQSLPVDHTYQQKIKEIALDLVLQEVSDVNDSPHQSSEPDLPDNLSGTCGTTWTYAATVKLIDLFREKRDMFQSPVMKKMEVWKIISKCLNDVGYKYAGEQCDKKMRQLKHRYKCIVDYNQKTGGNGSQWKYFHSMDNLMTGNSLSKPSCTASGIPVASIDSLPGSPTDTDLISGEPAEGTCGVNWTHAAIVKLIETFIEKRRMFEFPKIKKMEVWKTISECLNDAGHIYTGDQCDKKMRQLKHRYKSIVCCNEKTGTKGSQWKYFNLMEGLMTASSSVTPSCTESTIPVIATDSLSESTIPVITTDSLSESTTDTSLLLHTGAGGTCGMNWTHEATVKLIEIFKEKQDMFQSPVLKKTEVWNTVSNCLKKIGYKYAGEQCDKKMRQLKHRYKCIVDSNKKTGTKGSQWKYFYPMDNLMSDNSSVNPSRTISTLPMTVTDCLSDTSRECALTLREVATVTSPGTNSSRSALKRKETIKGTSLNAKARRTEQQPPQWFLDFVESQNKQLETMRKVQMEALEVAKQKNEILAKFTEAYVKKQI